MNRAETVFLLFVFGWCAAVVLTPLAVHGPGAIGVASEISYRVFGHVCHQWDSHSFHIAGAKLPVCIRCSMIYGTFFLACLAAVALRISAVESRRARMFLLFALLPMLIDVACDLTGFHQSNVITRIITGSIAGGSLGMILAPHCIEWLQMVLSHNHSGSV
ncbi:MAG: DUF2085 domain-containing protein [Ignavibacteriales bacterium]|nr:DUF2085 domain-containing protein [Ignavibacteriales bacterium]